MSNELKRIKQLIITASLVYLLNATCILQRASSDYAVYECSIYKSSIITIEKNVKNADLNISDTDGRFHRSCYGRIFCSCLFVRIGDNKCEPGNECEQYKNGTSQSHFSLQLWNSTAFNFSVIECKASASHSEENMVTEEGHTTTNVTICEHNSKTIRCEGSSVLDIKDANYGRLDWTTCNAGEQMGAYVSNTSCRAPDSLERVIETCQNLSSCSLKASNSFSWFGDPCPGILKYLKVNYTCITITSKSTPSSNTQVTVMIAAISSLPVVAILIFCMYIVRKRKTKSNSEASEMNSDRADRFSQSNKAYNRIQPSKEKNSKSVSGSSLNEYEEYQFQDNRVYTEITDESKEEAIKSHSPYLDTRTSNPDQCDIIKEVTMSSNEWNRHQNSSYEPYISQNKHLYEPYINRNQSHPQSKLYEPYIAKENVEKNNSYEDVGQVA